MTGVTASGGGLWWRADFATEVAMIARFGVLFALFLGCAPIASAQHVIPPVQLAYPSLNGTWNMGAPFLGTLTLTVNPNGALRGAYLSPLLGYYADCRGEFRGAGYFL